MLLVTSPVLSTLENSIWFPLPYFHIYFLIPNDTVGVQRSSMLFCLLQRVKKINSSVYWGMPNIFLCSVFFWFKGFVYLSVESLAGHKEIYCLGADSTDSAPGKAMDCEVEYVCVCGPAHNSGRVLFWEAPSGHWLQPPSAPRRKSMLESKRIQSASLPLKSSLSHHSSVRNLRIWGLNRYRVNHKNSTGVFVGWERERLWRLMGKCQGTGWLYLASILFNQHRPIQEYFQTSVEAGRPYNQFSQRSDVVTMGYLDFDAYFHTSSSYESSLDQNLFALTYTVNSSKYLRQKAEG